MQHRAVGNACTAHNLNKRRRFEEPMVSESVTKPKRLLPFLRRMTRVRTVSSAFEFRGRPARADVEKAGVLAFSVLVFTTRNGYPFRVCCNSIRHCPPKTTVVEIIAPLKALKKSQSSWPDILHPVVRKEMAEAHCIIHAFIVSRGAGIRVKISRSLSCIQGSLLWRLRQLPAGQSNLHHM